MPEAKPGQAARDVKVGLIGLGNVGMGALTIITENSRQIEEKLGFRLLVKTVCSRSAESKVLPPHAAGVRRTADWREVVADP